MSAAIADQRLIGRVLVVSQTLWLATALLTVGLFFYAVPARFQQLQSVCAGAACLGAALGVEDLRILQGWGLSRTAHAFYAVGLEVLFAGAHFIIAALIFGRKSSDRIALLVSLMLLTFGPATFTGTMYALTASTPGWQLPVSQLSSVTGSLPAWLLAPFSPWRLPVAYVASVGLVTVALFFFLFPDGRFFPRWGLPIVGAWVAWQVPTAFFPDSPLDAAHWPQPLAVATWTMFLGSFAYAQVYRYRRQPDPIVRQQTKWVVFGLVGALGGFYLTFVISSLLTALGIGNLFLRLVLLTAMYLAMLLMPLSFALAIFRTRLWDIDVIINRTLVYLPLTAILAGIFASLITFSQRLAVALTGQQSDAVTVLTTLLVVAALTPLKDNLQKLVDSRFKELPQPGKRLNAFAAEVRTRVVSVELNRLSRRLLDESALAFQAQGGAVTLQAGRRPGTVLTTGQWNGEAKVSVSIAADGVCYGSLALGPRRAGVPYTAQDRELLAQVAATAAQAIQQDQEQ